MMIIVAMILTDLVINSLLSSFCSFFQIKNKNQVFSKLVVREQEIFLFFGSIDFYKGIFLYVIPVRIIVPWVNAF